ncbi:MAG: CHAD domain-containing protein [Gammaproteobacteria bacterium]
MHDGKQLIHAFDILWAKYHKRLTACRHEASEDAVHRLRVATRRLLASIELLQALTAPRELRKLRKALKAQLDSFDELRDTQVMLLELSSALEKFPELTPFLTFLQVNEQELTARIPNILEGINNEKLQALVAKSRERLHHELGKKDLKPDILSIIDDRYRTALERYQLIDIVQAPTIHHTRIAVKKLRYMLESAEILLPPLPQNHLKLIHDYLTCMGEIQDSSVLLRALKSFFSEEIPLTVQTYYQHRHSTIINAYMSRREDIFLYWRREPGQPFPWTR